MEKFRTLNADEIEVRVARCTQNGAQLLLYKDARCDMNILDDTVGVDNWQRKHGEHKGNLFCSVGINVNYDLPELPEKWIWKEDAGAESNTEAEKGHASDSFKRACVNWGIGRELYTSPFIWVSGVSEQVNGKWVCKQTFTVSEIGYDDKRQIKNLTITDKSGNVVYQMGQAAPPPASKEEPVYCAECGAVVKPYYDTNGKPVTVKRHLGHSYKRFGKPLCVDCARKQVSE